MIENKSQSFWSITWQQFRKKKLAMYSMYFILILLYFATYAPYLSLDVPFKVVIEGNTQYPFFAELFNENRFHQKMDMIYNVFSFFLLPLTILHFVFKCLKKDTKKVWVFGMSFFAIATLVMLPMAKSSKYIGYEQYYGQEGAVFPMNPFGFLSCDPKDNLKAPGEHVDKFGRTFVFGSDDKSRDVLALVLYGTRISLTIGLVAVGIYVSIGIFLGALAGYFGGWWDIVISRAIEVMICFPTLPLIMILVTIFTPNIFSIMVIIGVTGWTGVARLVRADFLKLRDHDFVIAAQALGSKSKRVIFRHILPNALGPILVSAAFGVPAAILTESGLSFLGLGDTTSPSWGQLLQSGRVTGLKYWLIHPPGIAIFLTVSAMNLMGDGLRDALDPKLRGR